MKNRVLVLVFSFISLFASSASRYKVENIEQFNQKAKILQPGDSLILANGVWKDCEFKLKANGLEGKSIFLTAEIPGKVFIEGKSRLQFSGKFIHISGLVFRNGFTPKSVVVEFRTSSNEYAYNSILSNCVIDRFNNYKDSADHWVGIYGKNNRVEYCYFGGKANEGTTLVVWPNDSNSINNNHQIIHNYFGPRPRLGSNGGETIRIGTSQVCHLNSGSVVANNYFERCNGEVEVISNKSGGNKFLNNTFYECEGSMVLRHGENGVVAGNWFIGNGKPFTGGVRIINEGHQVYNNYFYKLRGDDFRSPLVIMNGIPNSPANGYAPVKNVIVANNTFVDCSVPWAFGVGAGSRDRTVTPESTLILNNIVYSPTETDLIRIYDKTDGIKLDNNLMISKAGILTGEGFVAGEIERGNVFGIDYITSKIKGKKLGFIRTDILGNLRSEPTIGAFQMAGADPKIEIASAENCGPAWYHPEHQITNQKPVTIVKVAPGTDILTRTIAKLNPGDVVELEEGVHIITRKIVLGKSITIRSIAGAKTNPVIRMEVQRENASMFEIEGSPTIRFENIAIMGDSKARFPVKYAIVTSKESASGYNLLIDGCIIQDFNVETGAIFNAYKGTIADTIKVSNSELGNAFRGFILSQEKDNNGKYSSEYVHFENSVFSKITQYVIDYYRGGTDESTIGGVFVVNHCVFDQTATLDEKQYILRTNGIVHVSVKNSIFQNSKAKTPLKLSGLKHNISNCNFWECADPVVEKGAVSNGLMYENPRFEKKSYIISKKSKLIGKATDGGNIGLK